MSSSGFPLRLNTTNNLSWSPSCLSSVHIRLQRTNHKLIMIKIQVPIVNCCSPRVLTFTRPDTMVPSVALWHRFAEGNGDGFTQLALLGGGIYLELLVYIPEASTLGFSEAVDPPLFLPLNSEFLKFAILIS
ncbi:hypothetical protein Tco_0938393 [Tanacetum coccineum]|uniref:Uncharacterized protein n=1 Tax=Tanacetum coccineum TaxID=301880 RepID=A0ABQ5DI08_9ASTR